LAAVWAFMISPDWLLSLLAGFKSGAEVAD
jgi:hypothetical protein